MKKIIKFWIIFTFAVFAMIIFHEITGHRKYEPDVTPVPLTKIFTNIPFYFLISVIIGLIFSILRKIFYFFNALIFFKTIKFEPLSDWEIKNLKEEKNKKEKPI